MKVSVLVIVLAACGGGMGPGDDVPPNHVTPMLIATGGVADAPLSGELHVYAVETGTSTPISGATIRVETATPLTGQTDATGLASFTDGALSGAVTITATAPGHAATTWIGAAGANVTLPLDKTPRTIPTAHVTGTIAGWNNLSNPPLGKYNLGVILYSFLDDPAAPENSIAQPMNGTTPLNTCINTGLSNTCSFEMNARIGKQIHTAVIVQGDPHGTNNDTSDDTYTLIGYAAGSVMTLTDGQQVTNESLAMVTTTTPLTITFPAAPAGLPSTIAIPELALDGDAGRIVFPLPTVSPSHTSATVLAPTGTFAGHYELVALATPSITATSPYATSFTHDVSGSATIPAWLAAPTAVQAGATFSFTAPGATFVSAQIIRGTQPLWNITILDGTSSFSLPTLTPDPIGAGSATFSVNAADAPGFDAKHFNVASSTGALARVAGAQASLH